MELADQPTVTLLDRSPNLSVPAHKPEVRTLPPDATFLRILAVNYVHLKTGDGGDQYVTEHGLPFVEHLRPENWYAGDWYRVAGERLEGTGTVYRVATRPIRNRKPASIQLVVKWSRVGQDVPLDTFTLGRAMRAEFNSPFEEFSLVEELRAGRYAPGARRILTQRPLAIYVPPESLQLWQTGRSAEKVRAKVRHHASVEIDVLRSYILLFGWIKGPDAVSAYQQTALNRQQQRDALAAVTANVDEEMLRNGFVVADHKPVHVIVRMRDGQIRRRIDGSTCYAVVDYELLQRTAEHDAAVKQQGRSRYLLLQRDRFSPAALEIACPASLRRTQVLGVDYIYGRAESTKGVIWVVGKHPELFGYFLPERWRSKQIQLSQRAQTWYAHSKDAIHLVWKVSHVGDLPPGDVTDPLVRQRILFGYNSPFEEFALAVEMQHKGLRTTYPRAIYATAKQAGQPSYALDDRRFERLSTLRSPDGEPVLPVEPDYITIWGYFRGLEDEHAPEGGTYWSPIGLSQAHVKGIISDTELGGFVDRQRHALAAAGYEDLDLKPSHILLSYIPGGDLRRSDDGQVELRQCNFELVKRL
jgi:hypothetical protein